MNNPLPGIIEKAFPGIFDQEKEKHHGLNEDFFFQLAQNARDIIFHAQLAPEFKFDYVSPSCLPITGYTQEEFYADPNLAKKCWHPDDLKNRVLQGPMEEYQPSKTPEEIRWIRKDGTVIWIERIVALSYDENGVPDSCQIIARDITARKKAEEAFQENQTFTQSLLEHAPHATVVINADTSIRYVNPTWEKLNGWTLSEVIGLKAPYPWWPPEEAEAWLSAFMESFKQKGGQGELPAVKKNGERYMIEISWTAVHKNGQLDYLLINSVDTTQRNKAEKALQASESKFSLAFNSSPDLMVITSKKDNKFIEVNESYVRNSGYTREEVIGHTAEELGSWVNNEERLKMLKILKEKGRVYNEEFRLFNKSREIRTMLFSMEKIMIGDEPCYMSVSNDITERKKAEAALKESEEKFSKVYNFSPNATCLMTADYKFIEANESFYRFTGYNKKEIYLRNHVDLALCENLEDQIYIGKCLHTTGQVFNKKINCRTKSGQIRAGLFSADTIEIGGEKRVIIVITDISDQVKANQALQESEEKFAKAFRDSPEIIAITTLKDGVYLDVNESYCRFTGYAREEVIGKSINDVKIWANENEREERFKLFREQGKVINKEYVFRTRSGELRTWLYSAERLTIGGQPCLMSASIDITEHKKAESLLRESEEKFSRAFNASPISLSISRLGDAKFLEVNESFLRDKGYTRDEIIGKSSKQLGIWVNPEKQTDFMQQLKAHGHVHNMEMQYRTKSGAVRTGLVSAELINLGSEPCMLVLNNDITQQKQAEEQLRLLSSVTKQVTDCTIITDPEFKITYINPAGLDMFGYNFDEVLGKDLSFFNQTPPSDEVKKNLREAVEAGKAYIDIIPKYRKDGTLMICDCKLSPMYDEQGRIVSHIDVQRDITRQKDVEAKLQEHKKLIDSILATMPEGVLVIDNHDRVLLANKAVYRILHINGRLYKNKPLSEVLPLDQYFSLHRALTSGSKENNTVEFRYNVQDTEKIIYCVIVKMDGERTLITFSDVSREREEEEKLYLTDRLASIGEMAAGLAHELNNPLTGILTLSQILVNSDLPGENKEDIECIYSEAKRAAGIVKNVLLFARKKPDESGRTNANDVIKDVLRLREYEQRTNNIKVVTELEHDLPDIAVDKGQLQQVFLNMISNAEGAIKEAERPGIITVTTQRVNSNVYIHFSDNGCGIKKQILPRIFDPFFTTKEVGKGTGLGLSICYSIIVKRGGKISVKSQVNEGSTFTIRMPIVN